MKKNQWILTAYLEMNEKTVLKGKEWQAYMIKHKMTQLDQLKLYCCTHNYEAIYKLVDYYFCFAIRRGYKNITSLKRLI